MARENAQDKGKRMLGEGRLRVTRVGTGNGWIVAECKGDSGGIYSLGYDPVKKQWRCTCEEYRGRCSHLAALQLVVAVDT